MMPDPLFRLIYLSHATRNFSEKKLEELLKASRQRNDMFQVSGLLLYLRDHFLQVLEGPRKDVLQLFENISEDPRHDQVEIMIQGEVPHRLFSEWSMAFSELDSAELESLAGFKFLSNLYLHKRNQREREVTDLIQSFIQTHSLK